MLDITIVEQKPVCLFLMYIFHGPATEIINIILQYKLFTFNFTWSSHAKI